MHVNLPPKQDFKLIKDKGGSDIVLAAPRCLNILLRAGSRDRTQSKELTDRYKLTGVTHRILSHSSFKYKFIR